MSQCLLIDDNQDERRALSEVLGRLGFELKVVSNADAALTELRSERPDVVVVTDRIGTRSRDLVQRLRRTAKGRPPVVIVYSSKPDTDAIGRMIIDGASEVIVKPFSQELISFKLKQAGVL